MQVLQELYVEMLVALLTQISVGVIYSHSLVLVWSTHTAYCWCDLLTQLTVGVIYSHNLLLVQSILTAYCGWDLFTQLCVGVIY